MSKNITNIFLKNVKKYNIMEINYDHTFFIYNHHLS